MGQCNGKSEEPEPKTPEPTHFESIVESVVSDWINYRCTNYGILTLLTFIQFSDVVLSYDEWLVLFVLIDEIIINLEESGENVCETRDILLTLSLESRVPRGLACIGAIRLIVKELLKTARSCNIPLLGRNVIESSWADTGQLAPELRYLCLAFVRNGESRSK